MREIKKICIILFILGVFLGGYSEIWRQGAKKVIQPRIEHAKEVYLHIIWDASGSMWGRDEGVEKVIRTREMLHDFLREIPDEYHLGLRMFGARRVGDTEDSYLAVSVSGNNCTDILRLVNSVKPLGKSPIGFSLLAACEDLQAVEGEKHILLISDGRDNGEVGFEQALEKIKKEGIVLHVLHAGNESDSSIRNNLRNLTRESGGVYINYYDSQQLLSVLKQY